MRAKQIIAAVALAVASCSAALAQSGSVKTGPQLNSEVNQFFPDQLAGAIIPFNTRQMLLDMIASGLNGPVSGTTCSPAQLTQYQLFVNTTGAPTGTTFNFFDGAQCVPWATLNQNSHVLSATFNGTVSAGANGGIGGQFIANGSTSGAGNIVAQAVAGTPTLTLPNASGTFAVSGTAPLSLNTTTGALSLTGIVPVPNGGTGIASGTSGGVLGFTGSTTIASSVALTQNGVVLGGGAGATPTSTAAGTNGQALTGVTGSAPTFQSLRQILPISNGSVGQPQNTTDFLLTILFTNEAAVQAVCPIGGTFKNFFLVATAPASGQTLAATWRINNADTAITCTITGPGTTCNDTTHTAACTAGQTYALKSVTSATAGTINGIAGGIEFDNP